MQIPGFRVYHYNNTVSQQYSISKHKVSHVLYGNKKCGKQMQNLSSSSKRSTVLTKYFVGLSSSDFAVSMEENT